MGWKCPNMSDSVRIHSEMSWNVEGEAAAMTARQRYWGERFGKAEIQIETETHTGSERGQRYSKTKSERERL